MSGGKAPDKDDRHSDWAGSVHDEADEPETIRKAMVGSNARTTARGDEDEVDALLKIADEALKESEESSPSGAALTESDEGPTRRRRIRRRGNMTASSPSPDRRAMHPPPIKASDKGPVVGSMPPLARSVPPKDTKTEATQRLDVQASPVRNWIGPLFVLAAGVAGLVWYQSAQQKPVATVKPVVQAVARQPESERAEQPGQPTTPLTKLEAMAEQRDEGRGSGSNPHQVSPAIPENKPLLPPEAVRPDKTRQEASRRSGGWEPWEVDDTNYAELRKENTPTSSPQNNAWNPWHDDTDYSKFTGSKEKVAQASSGQGDMASRVRNRLGISTQQETSQIPEQAPSEGTKVTPPIMGPQPFSTLAANSALQSTLAQASTCRQPGDPTGVARVAVTFSARSGRVTTALVQGPPFAGTATGGCIATKLRNASVPPFTGSNVTVSKTVVIQ
jgi:hypothetical protein